MKTMSVEQFLIISSRMSELQKRISDKTMQMLEELKEVMSTEEFISFLNELKGA